MESLVGYKTIPYNGRNIWLFVWIKETPKLLDGLENSLTFGNYTISGENRLKV